MLKRQLLDLLQDYPDDAVLSVKVGTAYKPIHTLGAIDGYHDIEYDDFVPECGGHMKIIVFYPNAT